MNKFQRFLPLLLLLPALLLLNGCRKDRMITDMSAKLDFSNDTILFDTLFTTVGSTTRQLKVYNNNNGKLLIDRIYLAGGAGTMYRMNVDGIAGRSFTDIEIESGDSMYIFVEVTVDPNSALTPMLVTDSIVFETNGNVQDVDLVAWGQDAYFHTPATGAGSPFFSLPCNDLWLNDKPHVIYGFAVVDSSCNLTIQPGTKIYSHPNSGLIVYNSGKLTAVGNDAQRIIFQGDRLEPDYDSLPGQWSGLIFLEAGNSNLEFADVRNASVGVRVETVTGNIDPLIMNYVRIENMSNFGVWNYKAGEIRMTNCLVNNCGQYAFVNTGGGFILLNHCTFANYWSYNNRSVPAFGLANFFVDENNVTYLVDLSAEINNCIIYGNQDNELVVNMNNGALGDFVFNTCYIKSDQDLTNTTKYISVVKNVSPQFQDGTNQNYHLLSSSPCKDAANVNFRADYDLDFYTRDGMPDIGCFEFH